jgi:hypothetical protein
MECRLQARKEDGGAKRGSRAGSLEPIAQPLARRPSFSTSPSITIRTAFTYAFQGMPHRCWGFVKASGSYINQQMFIQKRQRRHTVRAHIPRSDITVHRPGG